MFYNNQISSETLYAEFISPDDLSYNKLQDHEKAGAKIKDSLEGINKYTWVFEIRNDSEIWCIREDTQEATKLYTGNNLTEVYGSFDRNMNPCYIYKENGNYQFVWFNTVTNRNVTEGLGDVRSPRITHDDKRDEALVYSDIIITYIRDDKVYYKLQRDRYTIEHFAFEEKVKGRSIKSFGMNKGLRLQWELVQNSKIK